MFHPTSVGRPSGVLRAPPPGLTQGTKVVMPQAIPIHTRSASDVACVLTAGMISPAIGRAPSKASVSQSLLLDATCRSAMAI